MVKSQAVFFSGKVDWLPFFPKCLVPGTAIGPLPDTFLFKFVGSQPNLVVHSSHFLSHPDVVVGDLGASCGQVAALFLAKLLSSIPGLLSVAPVVAVGAIFLPALFASCDALVIAY